MSVHQFPGKPNSSSGSSSGGSDSHMEARVAKLEAFAESTDRRLGQIEGDIRSLIKYGVGAFVITWTGLIAGFIGIAYLIARGFGWIS